MSLVSQRVLFLIIVLAVAATGCQMHESGVTVQTLLDEEAPTSESWSPNMHISENGLPRLHMKADYMARYETPDSTYMIMTALDGASKRVRVSIFDSEGDSSAVVTSDRITYFERARRFVAEGGVVVQAQNDRWLFSEHLAWTEINSRVRTPGFATIQTPSETLSGYGLDADEDLQDFSLARVSGVVMVEDE